MDIAAASTMLALLERNCSRLKGIPDAFTFVPLANPLPAHTDLVPVQTGLEAPSDRSDSGELGPGRLQAPLAFDEAV
jgi:hypothetical protein